MKDGDLVYVPDNVAKKVYVLGEVVQPTAVQIERDSMTLAEALANARGPTPAWRSAPGTGWSSPGPDWSRPAATTRPRPPLRKQAGRTEGIAACARSSWVASR